MATGSAPTPMEGVVVVKEFKPKMNSMNVWNNFVTESGKFKIGPKESAFSSIKSRFAYIRLLINGFNTLPEFADVSWDELKDPTNGYANFQTLLNMVQVPVDHDGFYINDKKKTHLKSTFLSSPAK